MAKEQNENIGSINGMGEMRSCKACRKPMSEGYCIEGGMEYYCSKVCLNTEISDEKFDELYADGEGDSYWTEWEEDDDFDDETNPDGVDTYHLWDCQGDNA